MAHNQPDHSYGLHPLAADATIASVTVTINVTIPLYANSSYVSCPSSAQASILEVGVGGCMGVHGVAWGCMV